MRASSLGIFERFVALGFMRKVSGVMARELAERLGTVSEIDGLCARHLRRPRSAAPWRSGGSTRPPIGRQTLP